MNILTNLRVLQNALNNINDDDEFKLALVSDERTYCALGLVGTIPHFQAMGFKLVGRHLVGPNGGLLTTNQLDAVFGDVSFGRLFAIRGLGIWDNHLTDDDEFGPDDSVSDRQLAMARVQRQLACYLP